MKSSILLIVCIVALGVQATKWNTFRSELELQGFKQQESVFRNKDIYMKDGEKVLVHKQVKKHTSVADLLAQMEENHKKFDWKAISPSVVERRTNGPPIGLIPEDYFRFIPTYVGNAIPGGKPVQWSSSCFGSLTASAEIVKDDQGNFNGIRMFVNAENKIDWTCDDGYLFATAEGFSVDYYEFEGNSSVWFTGEFPEEEQFDMIQNGIRLFRFTDDVTLTVVDIWETLQLFLGSLIGAEVPTWTAEDNLNFLENYANWTIEYRSINYVDFPEDQIQSGWFVAVLRLDGLDPMLAWGMGSRTGHTAITLRIDGELYVCESTIADNYWPTNGVQKTPWKQWIAQAQKANYNVALLPLNAEYQALFNEKAALEWYNTVEGLPYGFHNLLFGWIDTPNDNYPPPLTSELVMVFLVFLDDVVKTISPSQINTTDFWAQALNHRINTTGLNIQQVYEAAAKQGISFGDLVTIVEDDSWNYQFENQTGPAMVCDVLVSRMYKSAGIFGNITNTIQGGEFTNWDIYTMAIFDGDFQRPSQCVAADPNLPYCQLMGEIRMELLHYNTFKPFPHMREHCPGIPPDYKKPANC